MLQLFGLCSRWRNCFFSLVLTFSITVCALKIYIFVFFFICRLYQKLKLNVNPWWRHWNTNFIRKKGWVINKSNVPWIAQIIQNVYIHKPQIICIYIKNILTFTSLYLRGELKNRWQCPFVVEVTSYVSIPSSNRQNGETPLSINLNMSWCRSVITYFH